MAIFARLLETPEPFQANIALIMNQHNDRMPNTSLNYGKEKKVSNFDLLLSTYFFELLKILLGSDSESNYLLCKKIRNQKS